MQVFPIICQPGIKPFTDLCSSFWPLNKASPHETPNRFYDILLQTIIIVQYIVTMLVLLL